MVVLLGGVAMFLWISERMAKEYDVMYDRIVASATVSVLSV